MTRIETYWFLTDLHQPRLKIFFPLTQMGSDWHGTDFGMNRNKSDWSGINFNPKLLPAWDRVGERWVSFGVCGVAGCDQLMKKKIVQFPLVNFPGIPLTANAFSETFFLGPFFMRAFFLGSFFPGTFFPKTFFPGIRSPRTFFTTEAFFREYFFPKNLFSRTFPEAFFSVHHGEEVRRKPREEGWR